MPDVLRSVSVLWRAIVEPHITNDLHEPIPDEPARRFVEAVARRAAREPVSHILGHRAFWRDEFEVTRDVLDPRPETETLVAAARDLVEPWRLDPVDWDAPEGEDGDCPDFEGTVLDLGTGSGCVLLSILRNHRYASGLGTDISEAALAVARRNADRLGLGERARFRRADWLDGIDGLFDLIVSNPPYIAQDEIAGLAPEVRDWEPRLALTPGGDGLDAYRVIAREAPARLAPGGWLLVEIGSTQGESVAALFRAAGLLDVRLRSDIDGRDRVCMARLGGNPPRMVDFGL